MCFAVILEQYAIAASSYSSSYCSSCEWCVAALRLLPLQKQRGIIVTRVDGKIYDGVFASNGDEWKRRRHILTPAFSASKMKLVSVHCSTNLRVSHVCNNGVVVWTFWSLYAAVPVCVCVVLYLVCSPSPCWAFYIVLPFPLIYRWSLLLRRAHLDLLRRSVQQQRMGKLWKHFSKPITCLNLCVLCLGLCVQQVRLCCLTIMGANVTLGKARTWCCKGS